MLGETRPPKFCPHPDEESSAALLQDHPEHVDPKRVDPEHVATEHADPKQVDPPPIQGLDAHDEAPGLLSGLRRSQRLATHRA